jgi:hypothetical protein
MTKNTASAQNNLIYNFSLQKYAAVEMCAVHCSEVAEDFIVCIQEFNLFKHSKLQDYLQLLPDKICTGKCI